MARGPKTISLSVRELIHAKIFSVFSPSLIFQIPSTYLAAMAPTSSTAAPVVKNKKMSKLESCWLPKPKRKGVKGADYKGKPRGRKPKVVKE